MNRTHRALTRPTLERLEGRALMATAGGLDPNFGTAGYYSAALNPGTSTGLSSVTSVATEADGSILEAGFAGKTASTLAVVHLTASGALDTTFGSGGEADFSPPAKASLYGPVSLLVQSDGKILVTVTTPTVTGTTSTSDLVLERLDANGRPDPTFGTNGQVVIGPDGTPIGGGTFQYASLQFDGKIVLAGSVPPPNASTLMTVVAVARLDANGQPDTTYGTNGLTLVSAVTQSQIRGYSSVNESASGLVIQPDGRAVVTASVMARFPLTIQPFLEGAEVFRLNTDGTQDTSLSQAGLKAANVLAADSEPVLQPTGQIVLIGTVVTVSNAQDSYNPIAVRLNVDGSLNATNALPGLSYSDVRALGVQPDGRILTTGEVSSAAVGNYRGTFARVHRLNPDLTTDATFGTAGVETLSLPVAPPPATSGNNYNQFVPADNFAITATGQILLAGVSYTSVNNVGVLPEVNVVARLDPNSTPATPGDFTGDGISDPAIYLPASGSFAIQDLTGKTAGKTVQFGSAGPGNSIPAPGDYYGTGVTDIAVYLPQFGLFAVQDPTGKTTGKTVQLGTTGKGNSIPTPGDYYGTGVTDFAVYLPQFGLFAVQDPTGKTAGKTVQLGSAGIGQSIPAPGDYYGTGVTDLAVYLPKIGAFAVQDPTGKTAGQVVPFGMPGPGNSLPMPGDYDGSGRTEFAVYVPSQGAFYYRPARGGPDVMVQFGTKGPGQTLPMQGDYTGSGKTDLGVYLAAYGAFAYQPPTGAGSIEQFGTPGFGATIPVTTTVLNPFPGTTTPPGSGSGNAVAVPGVLGEADLLDFLPATTAKKPGSGASSAS